MRKFIMWLSTHAHACMQPPRSCPISNIKKSKFNIKNKILNIYKPTVESECLYMPLGNRLMALDGKLMIISKIIITETWGKLY